MLMTGYRTRDGHRHARQDLDDVDADRRRCSTAASTRRSPSAATWGGGHRTPTTAAATTSSPRPTRATVRSWSTHPHVRGRHQHRGGPPRLLRQRARPTPRCSTTSSTGSPRTARWCVCVDDPGAAPAGRARRGPRRARADQLRDARTAPGWRAAARLGTAGHGRGGTSAVVAGEAAAAGDATVGARQAHGARTRSARCWRRSKRAPSPRCVLDGLAGFEGVRRRFDLVGVADRCASTTTTPITRPRCRATLTAARTLIGAGSRVPPTGAVVRSRCSSPTCTRAQSFSRATSARAQRRRPRVRARRLRRS